MPTCDIISFCCQKDYQKVYDGGTWFWDACRSHNYPFDTCWLLRQNVPAEVEELTCKNWYHWQVYERTREADVDPSIIDRYYPDGDPDAEEYTGPPNRAHYWKKHVMNHLTGMELSDADYILFQDIDIKLLDGADRPWIEVGIEVLRQNNDALMVTPNWGGADGIVRQDKNAWYVDTVSQQIFLIDRNRMKNIDWRAAWDWSMPTATGGPMQEFYYMLEGRLWRHMHPMGLLRAVLKDYRYWHYQW